MITNKKDILEEVNSIAVKINDVDNNENNIDVTDLRHQILSLLEDSIKIYSNSDLLDLWTKDSLVQALSFLRWNLGHDSHSTFMLIPCLMCIEDSTLPPEKLSSLYPHNKKRGEIINKFEQKDFLKEINDLKKCCH